MVRRLILAALAALLPGLAAAQTIHGPVTVGPGLTASGSTIGTYTPQTCDGVHAGSGNMTAPSATFTSSQAGFTAASIGKPIAVQGAGVAGATLVTTIAGVTNANTATLSVGASTSVTNAGYAYGTDKWAEIQAALTAGTPVFLPKGECVITQPLVINGDDRIIQGLGGGPYFPPYSSLLYVGSAASPVLTVMNANNSRIRAILKNFTIFGMCKATIGVDERALQASVWSDVHVENTTDSGFHFDISVDGNQDTGNVTLINLNAGVQNDCARNMRGFVIEPGNTSHEMTRSTFIDARTLTMDGTGFDIYGLNSTVLWNTRMLRFAGGIGKAMELHDADSDPEQAHANSFFGLEAEGQIVSYGAKAFPAKDNYIYGYDVSTFPVNVDIRTNSTMYCSVTIQGGNTQYCSPWTSYLTQLLLDTNSRTAVMSGVSTNGGVILSGGNNAGGGANIELYGSTAASANNAFYDGLNHIFRDQPGSTSFLTIDTANSKVVVNHSLQFDNSAATAGVFGNTATSGLILSGGTSTTLGANLELYGGSAGVPNSAFLDATTTVFRDQSGATQQFLIDATAGHIREGLQTAPALTSCGTNPAIVGTDFAGTVTMGTGSPTGCVITFNATYAAAPHCSVTWQSNLATMQYVVAADKITLTQTATSSNLVDYICIARGGG